MSQIELYQFKSAMGVPNPSPFCVKVEGFLKLAGLDYKTVTLNDPRKAPKGKLPYIVYKGKQVADSQLIIEFLEKEFSLDLDSHLTPEEKAIHHAMRVMLDEHLYFVMVYSRWADDNNWPLLRERLFAAIPKLIRGVITNKIRAQVTGDLYSQGISRHTASEIYNIGIQDIQSLSTYLGDKQWFGGNQPCVLDICAMSYLVNWIKPPIDSPVAEAVKANEQLVAYTDRAMQRFFPGFA